MVLVFFTRLLGLETISLGFDILLGPRRRKQQKESITKGCLLVSWRILQLSNLHPLKIFMILLPSLEIVETKELLIYVAGKKQIYWIRINWGSCSQDGA